MSENSGTGGAFGPLLSAARAKRAVTVLAVGLVSGVSVIIGFLALATLVFSGDLAPYLSQGIGLVLFGILAGCIVIALCSGFLGAVSAPAVPTMLMLGVIGASLTATGEQLFPTMVAVIVLCSLATAACALLIWRLRLAHLVRFVPYPVSSGFVAGTGGIACVLALSLMGVRPEAEAVEKMFEPLVAANWGIGIAYGFGLHFATQRWRNFLVMPVSFILLGAACHLGLAALGVTDAEAEASGFLFASLSEANPWPPVSLDDAAKVDWVAVAQQIPNILTLVLVTLLCVVIYVGGLELASNRELDWNREFGAVGLAGAAASLGGGPPSCPIVPTSLRSIMLGSDQRSTGVVAALVVGSPLLFGDAVLKLVPMPLMGGALLFTGIALLDQWVLKVRKRLPRTDYAIILAVFATIMAFGFFEGVALGVVITIAVLVLRMGREGVVESTFTAREAHSNRSRPVPERAILRTEGVLVQGYRLRGHLFFGGGYPLADRLKESLKNDPKPLCILLDFTAVSGFDFSTANAICRFMLAARAAGTKVVLGGAPEQLGAELRRNLPPPVFDNLEFASDGERALAYCEDQVIEAYRARSDTAGRSKSSLLEAVGQELEQRLDHQITFESLIDRLEGWFEAREYDAGDTILAIGQPAEHLQLIVRGQASQHDAQGVRHRQIGPGEPVAPQLPFNAPASAIAVVADAACVCAVLTTTGLQLLEESDRSLALDLYRHLLSAEPKPPNADAPVAPDGHSR
ncbi:MAG: hypothetical protein F4Z84_10565 [Gammaproteobacteria bacterium]|nr:hypothetical protein [Gammaproteobacteria bacterium]